MGDQWKRLHKPKKCLLIVSLLFFGTFLNAELNGQTITILSYQGLFDKSDLVIVARPIQVGFTGESVILARGDNATTTVPSLGQEVQLQVDATLKGNYPENNLVLLHWFKPKDSKIINDLSRNYRYMFFLRLDKDGRYSPTDGQFVPRFNSIKRLD